MVTHIQWYDYMIDFQVEMMITNIHERYDHITDFEGSFRVYQSIIEMCLSIIIQVDMRSLRGKW